LRKTPFFGKLAKIAENCDHNIDPWSDSISHEDKMPLDHAAKVYINNIIILGVKFQIGLKKIDVLTFSLFLKKNVTILYPEGIRSLNP
jgi:hypothetical protein